MNSGDIVEIRMSQFHINTVIRTFPDAGKYGELMSISIPVLMASQARELNIMSTLSVTEL